MHNSNRKPLFAYSLFDFANSAFTLIFHAYLFPLYLRQFVFNMGNNGDLAWGVLLSVSALIAALLAPFVGHWADRSGRWKIFSLIAVTSFLATGVLASLIGTIAWAIMGAFILA